MAAIASRLFLPIFLITIVQARILKLNSSDDNLISDGVSHVEKQEPIPNTCDHQYGFLPCAENSAGYIFQILVYQGLLIYGEKQLGSGSKVLLHILGVEKFGGIIFRILMALPSMVLMIGMFLLKKQQQRPALRNVSKGASNTDSTSAAFGIGLKSLEFQIIRITGHTFMFSTTEGSNSISSLASLNAVSASFSSVSSHFPPGNATSPETESGDVLVGLGEERSFGLQISRYEPQLYCV